MYKKLYLLHMFKTRFKPKLMLALNYKFTETCCGSFIVKFYFLTVYWGKDWFPFECAMYVGVCTK